MFYDLNIAHSIIEYNILRWI